MNSETLGLALFTATQLEISPLGSKLLRPISWPFKPQQIPIHKMAISQRINQVRKDSYLLELSELHKIGVHVEPSSRRTALLLDPKRTDGPNGGKSREKELLLSLKPENPSPLSICSFHFEKKTICFCLIHLNISLIPNVSISSYF